MAEKQEKKTQVAFEDIIFSGYDKLTPAQAAFKANMTETWVPKCGEEAIVHTQEDYAKFLKDFESVVQDLFKEYAKNMPPIDSMGVTTRVETIDYTAVYEGDAINGSKCSVEIAIYEPEGGIKGDRLGMIYIHGGGMGIFDGKETALNVGAATYGAQGYVGIVVRFTNSTEARFPRGLLDCVEAIKWAKTNLNLAGICVFGESGGGNLTLATGLHCKKSDETKDLIDCLYVACPYLHANMYDDEVPDDIKGSHLEFKEPVKGSMKMAEYIMACFKYLYTPEGSAYVKDPIAWPYYATLEDLKGLPPTFVVNNECDALHDQGVRLHRQLVRAGVTSAHTTLTGTSHGCEGFNLMLGALESSRRVELLKYALEMKKANITPQKEADGDFGRHLRNIAVLFVSYNVLNFFL